MKKNFSRYCFLALALLVAAFLRFYQLNSVPSGLFGDELDIGYQAYSLWKTGKDYLGNSFPLYFQSFYEYRMPLLVYLTAPIVGIFGLSEWTVRVLPAFFGIANVYLLWHLLREKKPILANVAAFLLAVVPWHVHYSRSAFDVTLMLFLILLGTNFFLKSFSKNGFLPLSLFFFGLSFYAYSTATVFLLFFLPVLFYLAFRQGSKFAKKTLFTSFISFIFVCLPLAISLLNGKALSRFSGINIVSDPKIVDQIVFKRSQDDGKGRLYHNKLTSISRNFAGNYLMSFSDPFLFISGDPNPRHSPPGFGQLFYVFLPFLLFGVYKAVRKNQYLDKTFFAWLLLAPIPSALTVDGAAHATRLFLMLPSLIYFTSLGVVEFFSKLEKKWQFFAGLFVCFWLLAEMTLYFHDYFHHYPKESWQYFNYGHKEIFQALSENEDNYDRVFINARRDPPLISFLFWAKVDPDWFIKNYQGQKVEENIVDGFDGFRLGKYNFGFASQPDRLSSLIDKNALYIAFQGDEIPGDWNWQESPPEAIRTIKMVKEPISNLPYMYLLTGNEN